MVQALIVLLLLAGLTIGGQQWYIGHQSDKHEAYKSKVIAATVKAEQAAIATTKAPATMPATARPSTQKIARTGHGKRFFFGGVCLGLGDAAP